MRATSSHVAWIAAWVLATACTSEQVIPPTQVVVVVESDAPRDTFARIEARVQSEDGARVVGEPLVFALGTAPSSYALPLSFGVLQPRAGADVFRLVVTAHDGGATVSESKSVIHFTERIAQTKATPPGLVQHIAPSAIAPEARQG
jgi:hypothetical protein